jgi:uncharacterized protein YyaL (SSP411 family)
LLMRMKEEGDGVVPSGNSVAALNGLVLTALTGRAEYAANVRKTLRHYSSALQAQPVNWMKMLEAVEFDAYGHRLVVVMGSPGSKDTDALLGTARRMPSPPTLVVPCDPEAIGRLVPFLPFLGGMRQANGRATAFVCVEFACRTPVTDPEALMSMLNPS